MKRLLVSLAIELAVLIVWAWYVENVWWVERLTGV